MIDRIEYRAHIDGLRAIAVLGVLVFHFGASWLPGGFVGVDVFFVISGFLISKSLYRDISQSNFSVGEFYERRVRRIAPAFIVTTASTWLFAQFILFPVELVNLANSIIYSSIFSANIYFYFTSGYFTPAAHDLPLLHLWSLGVEEQFYILFPLVVMLICRFRARALPIVMIALFVASLIACQVILRRDPAAAFYLLPFRAFELLVGAILALPGMRFPASCRIANGAILIGLAMILGAMALMSSATRFPGVSALLPCLGAALIIWGGECAGTSMAVVLGTAVLRFLGKISFSLYLVHWPLAVFARMLMPDLAPGLFLGGGLALSTFLAWLSWAYVEQPFRQSKRPLFSRSTLFATTTIALAGLMVSAMFVRASGGFPHRLTAEINEVLAFSSYAYQPVFREGTCFLRSEQVPADLGQDCLPKSGPRIVLWGSSHIAQFFGGLEKPAAQQGFQLGQITGSACIPLINWDHPGRPNCRALNSFALEWLLSNKPTMVVMGGDPLTDLSLLALLDASIERLVSADIKVVLLGPAPYYRRSVPHIVAERLQRGDRNQKASGELQQLSQDADVIMKERYGKRQGVTYISFLDQLCSRSGCELSDGNVPLHFDTVHFTAMGSALYGQRLMPALIQSIR